MRQPACTILNTTHWDIHVGIVGQVTKLKINDTIAYVRENIRYNSFAVSSSERLGMKIRGTLPRDALQVLELAAPKQHWNEIAIVVAQIEAKQPNGSSRPIVKNSRFTLEWAQHQFHEHQTQMVADFYQEQNSTFSHQGKTFDLNVLFRQRREIASISVAELEWILQHTPPLDPDRVDRADLTAPILATRFEDKVLTIDGLHRVTKAKRDRVATLPGHWVTEAELAAAQIPNVGDFVTLKRLPSQRQIQRRAGSKSNPEDLRPDSQFQVLDVDAEAMELSFQGSAAFVWPRGEIAAIFSGTQNDVGSAQFCDIEKPLDHIAKISPKLQKQVDRLRSSAAKLAHEIEQKRNPGWAGHRMTSSRFNDCEKMIRWAERWSKVHQVMMAIATAIEAGDCPEILHNLWQKSYVEELVFPPDFGPERISVIANHFKDVEKFNEAIAAIASLPKPEPIVTPAEVYLKCKQWDLLRRSHYFKGFVPTPEPLAIQMIEWAEIEDGMDVLEPSAGSAAIALPLSRRLGIKLSVIELHPEFRELLCLMNFNLVGEDFLQHRERHDRILMNPPFEDFIDADHIQHAFECLNSLGRLVSLCSAGLCYRSDAKAKAFRAWLKAVGGQWQKLPPSSFQGSQRSVGVSACIVVINRDRPTPPLPTLTPEVETEEAEAIASPAEIIRELLRNSQAAHHHLSNFQKLLAGETVSDLENFEPLLTTSETSLNPEAETMQLANDSLDQIVDTLNAIELALESPNQRQAEEKPLMRRADPIEFVQGVLF